MVWRTPKKLKGLKWKRKGRMMTERQFYGSNLHFYSEEPYSVYKTAFKKRFKK